MRFLETMGPGFAFVDKITPKLYGENNTGFQFYLLKISRLAFQVAPSPCNKHNVLY